MKKPAKTQKFLDLPKFTTRRRFLAFPASSWKDPDLIFTNYPHDDDHRLEIAIKEGAASNLPPCSIHCQSERLPPFIHHLLPSVTLPYEP